MKLKNIIYVCVIICVLCCSCQRKGEKQSGASYNYSLQKSDKRLTYELDNSTSSRFPTLLPFTSKNGDKYLSLQPLSQNKILIYELYSGNHYKTLEIDQEGPNGISRLLGYFIKDFDEIYLTNPNLPIIMRTDTTGQISQKINYGFTDEKMMLVPTFISSNNPYTPLVIIQDTFYITQQPMPGKEPDAWPVSCYIDTTHQSVRALPFSFPPILRGDELRTTGIGLELAYSRCFNGSRFVYSFYFEEEITVASIDHKEVLKIPAKSKYIKQINDPHEKRQQDMVQDVKRKCEAAFYGDLIYDQYRDVYYRIAYPETPMENEDFKTLVDTWTIGRKNFSIIILDKDFNIIGETLFTDYSCCARVMFVEEEGLYIQSNHFKQPGYNENELVFTCYQLAKKS